MGISIIIYIRAMTENMANLNIWRVLCSRKLIMRENNPSNTDVFEKAVKCQITETNLDK